MNIVDVYLEQLMLDEKAALVKNTSSVLKKI